MDSQIVIGMLIVVAILAGGLAVAYAWGALASRARVHLYEAASGVVDDPATPAYDRRVCHAFMENARSSRAAWVVVQAMYSSLVASEEKLRTADQRISGGRIPRETKVRVTSWFALSVLFANPVAAALCVPLIAAMIVRGMLHHQRAKSVIGNATVMVRGDRLRHC